MKKILPFLAAILLLQVIGRQGYAQSKATISGSVSDSAARKPLQFVTVELYKAGAMTQPVKAVFTTDKGRFIFSNIDTGNYMIAVSHTGFAERQHPVVVSDNKQVEMEPMFLSSSAGVLQNVTVRARKPLVELEDDKIVFNVENDPATKTETAIDILRKTPFVSVDGDNNIAVNGQTNFKVLLNGRETSMFAQNVKEALKGFPGALITKIEVITSPSAKYDAEGVGGILNIITKKKVVGYNGSANIYYTNTGWYNLNSNFSAKFGKLGMTMFYGANTGRNIMGTSTMETVPRVPAYFSRRLLSGAREMNNFWNNGNAEVSYEVDTLNTFVLYGNISGGRGHHILDQTITTSFPSGVDSVSYYDLDSDMRFPTKTVGTDYIRKFTNKQKEFSVRFNGEFGNNKSFLNSVMDNPSVDRYVINESVAKNRQYTIQSDYILPLKGTQKLESGVKAIMRKATSDFAGRIKTSDAEDYKINRSNTDNFRYDQNVLSAYSSYSFKKGKTTFRLGARLEHTIVDGDFITSRTKVEQNYTNILPNLQASIKFSNAYTMVVTYSDRIQRPFIFNLNPFRNDNDPRFITYGNPNLQPQTIHSLAIQSRLMKEQTFAGITLTGSYSDNMIVMYSTFDAAKGITSTTSDNVGKEYALSANGNFNTKINKDWNVFVNGNVRYNNVENKFLNGQKNDGFSGNANLNTSYSINKLFNASAYAGFFKNPVSIQTRYPLNLWYGINAGYKFMKEKLTASIGLANFLKKDWDYKLVTIDPAFTYTSISRMPFRGISVSLSLNFGKMTESVSKKKGVANDDLLSAPSN